VSISTFVAQHHRADHWETLEAEYQQLDDFRLSYRRHRLGGSLGAKGEITQLGHTLSVSTIKLLPAAQLSIIRRPRVIVRSRPQSFHIHFGAGRLGLGLLLPAIVESEIPFVVVQRPSKAFDCLNAALDGPDGITISINNAPYTTLAWVSSMGHLPVDWAALLTGQQDASSPNPRGLFVCSDDDQLIDLLVRAASSYSTSLGPGLKFLKKTLAKSAAIFCIDPIDRMLYTGENDSVAVETLKSELSDCHIEVVPLMVDRICTKRLITAKEINIDTESYGGSIVVAEPGRSPFAGSTVITPHNQAEASYFIRRKVLMVNGLHTTLAFLSLKLKRASNCEAILDQHDHLVSPWSDVVLLRPIDSEEHLNTMRAWAVARLLVLTFE
jgi:hypothetical protein